MAVPWDKSQHTALTLWDIDRELQDAYETYEQWQARHRRTRSRWACIPGKNRDDAVGKALSLGRQVHRVLDSGKQAFGTRFEEGDGESRAIDSGLQHLTIGSKMPHSSLGTTPSSPI